MRVAVVTRYFSTSFHPWAGHSALQTLRILAETCEVKVFYMESRYPERLTPPSRTHPALDGSYRPGGVEVEYIPYPALPLVSRPLNGFMAGHSLLPHVRAYQPDVILNYVVYPDGFAALRIGEAIGCPVVVTAIGSDLNRISDPICGLLTRRVLRQADFVLTVSGDLRLTAIRLGAAPKRSRAILNGCDTSIFHPRDRAEARRALNLPAEAELVVYIGRIDRAKGLIELIDAVAALRAKRPRLCCYLVGDGSDEPLVQQAIQRHGAESTITVVPPCSSAGVAQWMAAADLVTLPSYREGCPNVIVEALAAGRPIVASNVGGIPELMDKGVGRMVPAMNVDALRDALDDVLGKSWDEKLISGRHSRSWADVARDVQGVLTDVVAARGHDGQPRPA